MFAKVVCVIQPSSALMTSVLYFDILVVMYYDVTGLTFAVYCDVTGMMSRDQLTKNAHTGKDELTVMNFLGLGVVMTLVHITNGVVV